MKKLAHSNLVWLGTSCGAYNVPPVISMLLAIMLVLVSTVHADQEQVEEPEQNSTQSGIRIIRGWACAPKGALTLKLNDYPPYPVPYGIARPDTKGICGDVNNGFATLVNYNVLGEGRHTLTLLDDGESIREVEFYVITPKLTKPLDKEGGFLTGAYGTGTATLSNGQDVYLKWSQAAQGFVVTGFFDPSAPITCAADNARVPVDDGYGTTVPWHIETRRGPYTDEWSKIKLDISFPNNNGVYYLLDLTFKQSGRTVYYCGKEETPHFSDDYQRCTAKHFDCEGFYDGECHSEITSESPSIIDFDKSFEVYYRNKKIACFN